MCSQLNFYLSNNILRFRIRCEGELIMAGSIISLKTLNRALDDVRDELDE